MSQTEKSPLRNRVFFGVGKTVGFFPIWIICIFKKNKCGPHKQNLYKLLSDCKSSIARFLSPVLILEQKNYKGTWTTKVHCESFQFTLSSTAGLVTSIYDCSNTLRTSFFINHSIQVCMHACIKLAANLEKCCPQQRINRRKYNKYNYILKDS